MQYSIVPGGAAVDKIRDEDADLDLLRLQTAPPRLERTGMPILGRVFEIPELGRRANELDADFSLAHEALSQASNASEDFLSGLWVSNGEEFVLQYVSGKQDQRAVRVDDQRVRFLP